MLVSALVLPCDQPPVIMTATLLGMMRFSGYSSTRVVWVTRTWELQGMLWIWISVLYCCRSFCLHHSRVCTFVDIGTANFVLLFYFRF